MVLSNNLLIFTPIPGEMIQFDGLNYDHMTYIAMVDGLNYDHVIRGEMIQHSCIIKMIFSWCLVQLNYQQNAIFGRKSRFSNLLGLDFTLFAMRWVGGAERLPGRWKTHVNDS